MIRSFGWRDVGLVKTLGEQGVCLDSETCLLRGNHSLQNALFAYLIPGTGAPTIVWRAKSNDGGRAAFGQLGHKIGEEQARILFIAPSCEEAPEAWTSLLEKLAVEAGDRGALNLLAEVNEEGCEFEALRTAGFAVYARQSVWQLAEGQLLQTNAHAVPLRPTTELDLLSVSTLCNNIIPRLVQQVEPVSQRVARGYVLEHRGEIVAFLDVRRGPLGSWVEPYLHPEAYKLSEAVLHTGLRLIAAGNEKIIYLCIHRYQDWLQEIVARAGFKALGSQAVMVKRLTARVKEPLRKALPVMETHVPTPITQAQIMKQDHKN
jgi:hypothetical protein